MVTWAVHLRLPENLLELHTIYNHLWVGSEPLPGMSPSLELDVE